MILRIRAGSVMMGMADVRDPQRGQARTSVAGTSAGSRDLPTGRNAGYGTSSGLTSRPVSADCSAASANWSTALPVGPSSRG